MRRFLVPVAVAALLLGASTAHADGKAGVPKWRGIPEGEAEAKKSGKPALYFFTAEWCGPCHTIKKEVFSDPKVAAAIEKRYVPIICEDTFRKMGVNPAGFDELAHRFGLRGLPTLVVARPGFKNGIRLEGWTGADTTREFIDEAASRLKEREAEGAKPKAAGGKP